MSDRIEPADAARALGEIDRRREQAIRRAVRAAFPRWHWWANAALMVPFTAAVESGRGVLLGAGIAVFVLGLLAVNVPVSRAARKAPPHGDLEPPGTARRVLLGLVGFVAILFGVLLATVFSLKAAAVPYPATIAVAVAAVVFAVGGQMLVRLETAGMVRRSRRQE